MAYSNLKYAYSVGRIRVLETRLLNHTGLERMIGSKNADEAFRVLHELDYASHSTDIHQVERFQEVITIGLRETKELLDQIAPYAEIMNILWIAYDIHNVKALIRAKHQQMPEEEVGSYLIPLGRYSHHLLEKYIQEGVYKEKICSELRKIIDKALGLAEKDSDYNKIDEYLDQQFFLIIRKLIKKTGNRFLNEYSMLMIDSNKIKTALRLKLLKHEDIAEHPIFQIKSCISRRVFQDFFAIQKLSEANALLLDMLKFSNYFPALSAGLEYFNKYHSFLKLEIELDNLMTRHLQKAKVIPFGPEPLISYFLAKQNNAQIIRTIMVGKINETDNSVIKNRLPLLYM